MRRFRLLPLLLLAAACGDDTLTVRGFLLPGSDATDVYVIGQPLRAVIEADSFIISGIEGEVAELEFTERGDRRGRMRLEGWNGPEMTLRGIWLDDGVAFATTLDGEGRAVVNELRMAAQGRLPERVEVGARVLAVSRRGDALLVRPDDEGMPDLRVVVTPGTSIETETGEPAELDFVFGDSLRVEGTSEGGYVVATALVVPAALEPAEEMAAPAAGAVESAPPALRDDDDDDDEVEEDDREGPRSLERPGRGRGRGRGLQIRRD